MPLAAPFDLSGAALSFAPLKRCAGASVVRTYLPPVGRAHDTDTTSAVLGASASIMGRSSYRTSSRGSDSSLCPDPMPQGQAALAFAEWGTPPQSVPHSPPGFHHSFSRLLSQAPLCEKALICSICKGWSECYSALQSCR